ncbi:ist1-like protein [Phtheirospermum japonicum]|uniref:Ist1-like protein n=1 Tax=Phtheirospermum japonicum TaxID=374723 RepID=A0A830BAJ1_9LAMI|nr:ist1-like protein [Phtheirospermum japonicum]
MAMFDSFFGPVFKASKCKTLLKLTIPRIKLLRNRREIQLKQMRREIAKLLETGQEATARIRVEHIIREEKMMAAQEIVELFCELITVRLPIIEAQRECPLDLKEAISSVCFAAPRCADLPELQQVQLMFAGKYGKEFVTAATELLPECGVNRQLVELLSVRAPAPDVKLKLLKEIAEEHELDWDPSASESELLKPHEDLLNGPTQTVSITKMPLPDFKHVETKSTTSKPPAHEKSDSDEDFEIIDFPEVPNQPIQSNKATVSAPEMLPFPASAFSEDEDQEEQNPSENNESHSHSGDKSSDQMESKKQFVPFIYPPSQSPPSSHSKEQNPPPSIPKTEYDNLDLQDVLAAAQMAADAAERAATAARSAASIARLRINELVKKDSDDVSGSTTDENPFHLEKPKSGFLEEMTELDSRGTFEDSNSPFTRHPTAHRPSYDDAEGVFDSLPKSSNVFGHGDFHQPQRLPSMDDETCFTYPNLFTSQGSNVSPQAQSFRDAK